jgi:hypothetical protein
MRPALFRFNVLARRLMLISVAVKAKTFTFASGRSAQAFSFLGMVRALLDDTPNCCLRAALICTFPVLTEFFTGSTKANLPSYLGTVYCFGNLFFLGIAQRNVGKVSKACSAV